MNIAGIDYGTKRIGLALGDDTVRIAFAAETIPGQDNPRRDAAAVALWAAANEVGAFVVGLPLNMDGSVGSQAARVEKFAAALREESGKPVEFEDERLTSYAADTALRARGFKRPKQSGLRDAVAAQVILKAYFERG